MFHQPHCMKKMPNMMDAGHTQRTKWQGGVSFLIYLYTLMLVVTRQGAFYLGNLLAFTYMQTPQLISVYSVLHKGINQFEVVCKGFQPAPINIQENHTIQTQSAVSIACQRAPCSGAHQRAWSLRTMNTTCSWTHSIRLPNNFKHHHTELWWK